MFPRATIRWKDGKPHRYWSVVESRRMTGKRAVHAAPAEEFGAVEQGGMHALALTLRTPEEHATMQRPGV
jgi:hypothetical protein